MDLLVNLGGVCLRDGESRGGIEKGTEGEGEFFYGSGEQK